MSRRGLLKTAAAGLVLPWWLGGTAKGVGAMPDRTDVTVRAALLQFKADREQGRYNFGRIYLQEETAHASDGRIAGRGPVVQPAHDGQEHDVPPFLEMWERFFPDQRGWRRLPGLNMVPLDPDDSNEWCDCGIECPKCDEDGYVWKLDEKTGECIDYRCCTNCKAKGWIFSKACPICYGDPRSVSGIEMFDGMRFASHYVQRIRRAAALFNVPAEFATFQVEGQLWAQGFVDCIQFRCGPIEGALCGLNRT